MSLVFTVCVRASALATQSFWCLGAELSLMVFIYYKISSHIPSYSYSSK